MVTISEMTFSVQCCHDLKTSANTEVHYIIVPSPSIHYTFFSSCGSRRAFSTSRTMRQSRCREAVRHVK
ncbi:hypothetical protein BDP81DRAFT_435075 [Colletotrichum phormii]|uniref:Uncharacterized protein n=1 Tax=Colletotrichum phormii TaxID=359342 RepID=A0AAI9ZJ93_9PEZI|nr:uncharacterized protein BDP81DRAFT_435075 [Colletotrichum phormii]KAK1625624.1 hypothetical protein BDP81DRAFT_435075 [Colletotrichum phormii]